MWELFAGSSFKFGSLDEDIMYDMLAYEVDGGQEEKNEHWIRMENGVDWMPERAVRLGDHKEAQGLWDDGVFEAISWDQLQEGYRLIGSRIVRRVKDDGVKSR